MNDFSWFSKLVWIASPFYKWENQCTQQTSGQAMKETQTVSSESRLNPFNILLVINNNRWPFLNTRDHVMCYVLCEHCLLTNPMGYKLCPGLTVEEMRFREWSLLSEERLRASAWAQLLPTPARILKILILCYASFLKGPMSCWWGLWGAGTGQTLQH